MATCKPFKGPTTPITLIQWLVSCEDIFKLASYGKETPIPDDFKVLSAGSAISPEAEDLFDWWASREEDLKQLSWNEFVDDITSWALGLDWKADALESFSRTEQGELTIEQYTTKLRAAHLVLKRAGIEISDFHYKCQLLFHASPIISALVKTTPNFDLSRVSIGALEQRMRVVAKDTASDKGKKPDSSSSSGSTSDTLPPYAYPGAGEFELSEQWGHTDSNNTPFTQMDFLPPRPDNLGRVVSVSLGGNDYLRGLKILIRPDKSRAAWALDTLTTTSPSLQDMSLDAGDYINCVVFTRGAGDVIGSAKIETKNGKSLTAGKIGIETNIFRAKHGQQIVGFHGQYWSRKEYIGKVGVIYAPLLAGEKET